MFKVYYICIKFYTEAMRKYCKVTLTFLHFYIHSCIDYSILIEKSLFILLLTSKREHSKLK